MSRMVTLDSLDDSLIERKQKEIHTLKAENDRIRLDLSKMTDSKNNWNHKYNDLLKKYRELERENSKISEKLLYYEHDPIIMKECYFEDENCIDILFWDTDTDKYELFASFYENNLEKDLKSFCEDFIIKIKDEYWVE